MFELFLEVSGVIAWTVVLHWLYDQSCGLARRIRWACHPNKKLRGEPWRS